MIKSEFYLIIYPWAETLEYGQSEFSWSKFGYQLCLSNKCKLIDTIPDFIEYKEYNKNWVNELYFVRDEHFNKGGAKLISDLVMQPRHLKHTEGQSFDQILLQLDLHLYCQNL